ncbi:MAG: phosphodiesterase [Pseudomonadota bacterium]
MVKLIWLSDLHFLAEGIDLGHDSRARLKAAIAFINQHHADSAYCVLSGDLVNRETAEDYSALAEHLGELRVPLLPMVGNHDDRHMLRSALPLPEGCMDDFIQYAVPTPDGLLLCLDTHKIGSPAGELCAERLAWFEHKLSAAGAGPVYVFMHHPPMPLGLPMQDMDRLDAGDAFLELAAAHGNVKYLFIGHVHRPITGTARGIPFATMRSVLYQAPAPVPQWDWDSFAPAEEAPNLGVLKLDGQGVTLEYVQFCAYADGT